MVGLGRTDRVNRAQWFGERSDEFDVDGGSGWGGGSGGRLAIPLDVIVAGPLRRLPSSRPPAGYLDLSRRSKREWKTLYRTRGAAAPAGVFVTQIVLKLLTGPRRNEDVHFPRRRCTRLMCVRSYVYIYMYIHALFIRVFRRKTPKKKTETARETSGHGRFSSEVRRRIRPPTGRRVNPFERLSDSTSRIERTTLSNLTRYERKKIINFFHLRNRDIP